MLEILRRNFQEDTIISSKLKFPHLKKVPSDEVQTMIIIIIYKIIVVKRPIVKKNQYYG